MPDKNQINDILNRTGINIKAREYVNADNGLDFHTQFPQWFSTHAVAYADLVKQYESLTSEYYS